MTIDEAKASVIAWRGLVASLAEQYKDLTAAFLIEHHALIAAKTAAIEAMHGAEDHLRTLALTCYKETFNKHPTPGVIIKEMTRLDYEEKDAFAWALAHEMCLQLDTKTFEAIAKGIALDFVTITKEPQVQLSKHFEEIL